MSYVFYPGCSLEGTALEYQTSTRALFKALGLTLEELPDWTCCGASAAEAVNGALAYLLAARNLALAETLGDAVEIVVPCSACYLNLKKVEVAIASDPGLLKRINAGLAEEQLVLKGACRVKHLLEVLAVDIGATALAPLVIRSLKGLRVIPYYGCQCLRPYPVFDDPERPTSMDALIAITGATPLDWRMGAKCCGASHITTDMQTGLYLVRKLLTAARGADLIVTVCPMCQMNLEAYQDKASAQAQQDLRIPVVYLPQLLGLALGFGPSETRLDLNLSVSRHSKLRTQVKGDCYV